MGLLPLRRILVECQIHSGTRDYAPRRFNCGGAAEKSKKEISQAKKTAFIRL
jgi:hypothetical protein